MSGIQCQLPTFSVFCTIGERCNPRATRYPDERVIKNVDDFMDAMKWDHVGCKLKNSYRKLDNFEACNVVFMDCDNTHSENPKDWKTAEDLQHVFNVNHYMVCYSRNHMKMKDGLAARPRFHVYFPINECRDAKALRDLKQNLLKSFPFDGAAVDAVRFLFGVEQPEVIVHKGRMTIDQHIPTQRKVIKEGERNSTLFNYAINVLTRLGNTSEAYDLFSKQADACDPPLEDREVWSVWESATRIHAKSISQKPDYVPPEEYSAVRFQPIVKQTEEPRKETTAVAVQESAQMLSAWETVGIRSLDDWELPDVKRDKEGRIVAIKQSLANAQAIVDRIPWLDTLGVNVRMRESGLWDIEGRAWSERTPAQSGMNLSCTPFFGEIEEGEITSLIARVGAEQRHSHVVHALRTRALRNSFDPWKRVVDRLPTKVEGGGKLAEEVFIKHLGADDTPYTRFASAAPLVAMLRRIKRYPEAYKYDYMTILSGPQGIGKSSIVENLSKPFDQKFVKPAFTTISTLQMADQKGLERIKGRVIAEVGEMAGISKGEMSDMKSFLSQTIDSYRAAYARNVTSEARSAIIYGTMNPVEGMDIFREGLAERRFWVVDCHATRDTVVYPTAEDIIQILASANYLEQQGYPTEPWPELWEEHGKVVKETMLNNMSTLDETVEDILNQNPSWHDERMITARRIDFVIRERGLVGNRYDPDKDIPRALRKLGYEQVKVMGKRFYRIATK